MSKRDIEQRVTHGGDDDDDRKLTSRARELNAIGAFYVLKRVARVAGSSVE